MFESQYIKQRIQKAQDIRDMGFNPYRNDALKNISNQDFIQLFEYLKLSSETKDSSKKYSIAGRVKFLRLMGKACFVKIEDETGILQAYLSQNDLGEDFVFIKKTLEVGDIVNIEGYPFVTQTGELSIHTLGFKILTKSIIPLPEKFHGLTDIELRYRQRYLDLIANPNVKEIFKTRSLVVSNIRKFFEEKGFLEVETPMLHPIPGGANAKPFITHHNALDVERYLRIAPELYLKRLIVGGFEAIFEINRNFRNEGMDHSHNPEFTMIEFYWAYKTYEDLIKLTQELFFYLLEKLNLPKQIKHNESIINFENFRVMPYKKALEEIGNIPKEIIEDEDKLRGFLKQNQVKIDTSMNYGKILAEAFDSFVEPKLIDPIFITDYPIDISPLARRNDNKPEIADRFELFIGGKEIANGFSELNDPLDQLERFKEQVRAKDAGDEEAQYMDEDYIWALGYGMPPTAGEGIGIDRLVMLLTDSKTIKDIILFPAMKPVKMNYDDSILQEAKE
ncbi:lysine--tRNA ligase [Helicobacter sp. 13S00477-4]|uniref:lysine--tRNA ligase n=1 Tax=Helicobacter sp. 13S00477-4 TaxID=1905759 RepID=UPI000BA6DC4E|nr:lysine--tRNA ligase [Helicobacter sp. 13S00477-4]PAF52032.1 lysine--tRNA ligase [Helicobacter sp. 13S00477-4]